MGESKIVMSQVIQLEHFDCALFTLAGGLGEGGKGREEGSGICVYIDILEHLRTPSQLI